MSKFISQGTHNFQFLNQLNKYLGKNKGFIAGGTFMNLINNEPARDIDIYFENERDWGEAEIQYSKKKNFHKIYETPKVVCYRDKIGKINVELVRALFGTPEQVISNFDFTVTQFAYFREEIEENGETINTYRIMYHKDFWEHLHMKRLVIDSDHLLRPASTYERTYKYRDYGFKMCRESKVKLIEALRSADFTMEDLSASLYDGLD